jgi:1,2-phenylacetyl-CoA epoxidase PaaB subunit
VNSGAGREHWDVFAREDGSVPMRHVGSVEAVDADDAEVFATTLYDEFRWVEMFIAPRRAIIEVIRPE